MVINASQEQLEPHKILYFAMELVVVVVVVLVCLL
jgi:hypothetical protein